MRKTIYHLFVVIIFSVLIVSCGSSGGDDGGAANTWTGGRSVEAGSRDERGWQAPLAAILCRHPRWQACPSGDRHQRPRDWLAQVAKKALALFAADKKKRGLLDFPDLTLAAVKLLREGSAPRLHYKYVLLDENQDTNPVQAELMRLVQK